MESSNFNQEIEFPHAGYRPSRNHSFLVASLILGLLSILTCSTLVGGLICGSLGILFAILSREKDAKLKGTAVGGIFTSVIGLLLTIGLYSFIIYAIFSDGDLHDRLNKTYEQLYGVTIEDMLQGEMPEISPYAPISPNADDTL